jgi:hypothetical protein
MNKLPPTSGLAAAIKRLPRPNAYIPAQVADVYAFPFVARYRVTFVVRRNPGPGTEGWFWGIAHAEQVENCPAEPASESVTESEAGSGTVATVPQTGLLPQSVQETSRARTPHLS